MNQDEQIELALKCGAGKASYKDSDDVFVLFASELAAYTAAVEAKERERCAIIVDHILKEGTGTYGDAIRSLK